MLHNCIIYCVAEPGCLNRAAGKYGYRIYIDYVIESATYGFLFTSCKTLENERVSAANE